MARTRVHTYVHDDLWSRAFYRSTATVQTTHARLFVAVAALARHAACCLPLITSLINLTLVRLLLHLRPNYIHSTSNDIHTDGPRARARG